MHCETQPFHQSRSKRGCRSKTGCLNRRRRPTKCGEERPVPAIAPRASVIAKATTSVSSSLRLNTIIGLHRAHITFQAGAIAGLSPPDKPAYTGIGFDSTPFTNLRPRQIEHAHLSCLDTFQHEQQCSPGTTFSHVGPALPVQLIVANVMYQQPQAGDAASPQQPFQIRK